MSDHLLRLSKPFPKTYVHTNPSGGGSYVAHHVVVQALLATVGPFDFELVQMIRGDVAEAVRKKGKPEEYVLPPLSAAICGVVARLTCEIDGRRTSIEEVGDCEDPQNWPHDGARMKDAMSDALKRCAMRLGLGLALWSQEEYFLHDSLSKREASGKGTLATPQPDPPVETGKPATPSERTSVDPMMADIEAAQTQVLDLLVKLNVTRDQRLKLHDELFPGKTWPTLTVGELGLFSAALLEKYGGKK